ncbi:MAG TPA: extracellular solute-binding protein, partial [Roseiflexaceae bacterium]|nr:extracellular solute-binding protein [Roseiflexaceae bacterium]
PAQQPAATEAPAAEPTAAPAAEGPTPTPVVEFASEPQPGQKVLVWMVRTGLTENRWEKEVVIPAYQKAAPDVFIKVLNIVQDDIAVKREAMIAAKEPLHVWSPNWGGDGFASDRFRGLLTDMTPLIERDNWDTSDFIPSVFKIYNIEGKQYGIPFLTTGSYVYYNMKLFDEAGVPYPPSDWNDKSWTWDKFLETAKKLTKNYDDVNTAVYGGVNGLWPPFDSIPMMWGKDPFTPEALQKGFSDPVKITDETTVQAFQNIHDLVYVHKVAPDQAASQALDQLGGAFLSGRVAMFMTGGWGHWNYKDAIDDPNGFCWGAAPLPWGTPDANVRATIFTDPWAITAGMDQENTDLAWNFVKFLASAEQQKAYTEATGTPPVRQSLLDVYYKQYEKCVPAEKTKESFQGAFDHGRESSNHLLVKFDELSQTWDNLLGPFWSDPEGKAADVLPQIEADVNAALQRIREEAGQ